LAWIRTSIAVISLGFVVAKFSVWLRELALRLDPHTPAAGTRESLPIGVAMMALGGVLAVLAAWRYHKVNLAIEHGQVSADRGLVILVTVMIAALTVGMIVYMLMTADHS
jgi:putative membrane protein